jgi:vanillate O-demethylase ferredoxin subunit
MVRATRDLTRDVRLFEIVTDAPFVAPTPGGHIKVMVMIDGRADTRSYSIVGPWADGVYRLAVKLLPDTRGGSAYMWSLESGARLMLAGPDNHFGLSRGSGDYLLLAGGIGITPIFTHALALASTDVAFRVLYGARGRGDLALADALRAAIGDRLEIFPQDEGARIDLDREIARLPPDGEAYVCGPIGMLEAVKRAWAHSGRPFHLLRFETFGNSGTRPSVPFGIKIPRLGKDIVVPVGKTMLDALAEAGVAMIHDCRKGECGLCALKILDVDGIVDHRDVFFDDAEKATNAKLCTCVSRVYGASITVDTADR